MNRHNLYMSLLIILVCTLSACGGDDDPASIVTTAEPTILSVDPASVTEGIVVIIHGENFGTSGVLKVNDEEAPTSTWSDSRIVFTVPTGIYGSQVNITVTSGGRTSAVFPVPFFEATERQLTFDGMMCNNPCWSADGSHIYFGAEAPDGTAAFYSVPFNGGETALLYNGPGNDYMLDVQYYQTGSLIWVSDRDDGGNTGGDWEIREGESGFNPQGFVESFPGNNDTTERLPVWSHTEKLNVDCAWTQDRPAGGSMIYIQHLATPLALVSGYMPCFNPTDGTYLAYLTYSGGTGYDIMKIRAEQGATGELIYRDESTSHTALAWGAGGQIAYKKGLHIWIMDEDGTNHRKLTDGHDAEFAPKFSPNGEWVTFTRMTTTEHEVFVARVPY